MFETFHSRKSLSIQCCLKNCYDCNLARLWDVVAEEASHGSCGKFMAFFKCCIKEFGFHSQANISQNVFQDTDVCSSHTHAIHGIDVLFFK